jgi:hypothetical protein
VIYAPVALFAYRRLSILECTVQALAANTGAHLTDIYFFSDGPKNHLDEHSVYQVRNYLKTVQGFRSVNVINRDVNLGLTRNIVDGVTEILSQSDSVIVLEDDILTSPFFLQYMNQSLDLYRNDSRVSQVCAYSYLERDLAQKIDDSTYFVKGSDCLAWATWRSAWKAYMVDPWLLLKEIFKRNQVKEFNRSHSYNYYGMLYKSCICDSYSWAIRFYASNFLLGRFTLYPIKSLAVHVGNDQEATNYKYSNAQDPLDVPLSYEPLELLPIPVFEDNHVRSYYNQYLKKSQLGKRWYLKILFDSVVVPFLTIINCPRMTHD